MKERKKERKKRTKVKGGKETEWKVESPNMPTWWLWYYKIAVR